MLFLLSLLFVTCTAQVAACPPQLQFAFDAFPKVSRLGAMQPVAVNATIRGEQWRFLFSLYDAIPFPAPSGPSVCQNSTSKKCCSLFGTDSRNQTYCFGLIDAITLSPDQITVVFTFTSVDRYCTGPICFPLTASGKLTLVDRDEATAIIVVPNNETSVSVFGHLPFLVPNTLPCMFVDEPDSNFTYNSCPASSPVCAPRPTSQDEIVGTCYARDRNRFFGFFAQWNVYCNTPVDGSDANLKALVDGLCSGHCEKFSTWDYEVSLNSVAMLTSSFVFNTIDTIRDLSDHNSIAQYLSASLQQELQQAFLAANKSVVTNQQVVEGVLENAKDAITKLNALFNSQCKPVLGDPLKNLVLYCRGAANATTYCQTTAKRQQNIYQSSSVPTYWNTVLGIAISAYQSISQFTFPTTLGGCNPDAVNSVRVADAFALVGMLQ